MILDWFRRGERRASIENPNVPLTPANILAMFGAEGAGGQVTIDSALGVPAVFAAVNFLPATIAGLPLHVYRRNGASRTRAGGTLDDLLSHAVNDETSSFDWRKYTFEQVFTGGRGYTYIERNAAGLVQALHPLDPDHVLVERIDNRLRYTYREGFAQRRYEAREIIDVPYMLRSNRVHHRSPIFTNREVIAAAQAVTKYGAKFFEDGGVPPFVIEGPMNSPAAMQRAGQDLQAAVRSASKERRLALALPAGHKVTPFGVDAQKAQLVEANRFLIEQIARIYQLPPVFLQDLTHGTFANTEQQDLHFVKHTLRRWVGQLEQELNLKLFRRGSSFFVEMNVDGILRGDFKTRMDGYASAVQHGILTPNEARRRENLADQKPADRLFVQGAMVPLDQAGASLQNNGNGQ